MKFELVPLKYVYRSIKLIIESVFLQMVSADNA